MDSPFPFTPEKKRKKEKEKNLEKVTKVVSLWENFWKYKLPNKASFLGLTVKKICFLPIPW